MSAASVSGPMSPDPEKNWCLPADQAQTVGSGGDAPSRGAPNARPKIMAAVVKLIAERGLKGFSLREVLRASGQANNSAIHHHFGSKLRLISEVYDAEIARIEKERVILLRSYKSVEQISASETLFIILRSVFKAYPDRAELDRFVRFDLHLILSDPKDPLFEDDREPEVTRKLNARIRDCYRHLPDEIFRFRMTLGITTFLQAVAQNAVLERAGNTPFPDQDALCAELVQGLLALLDQPHPATFQFDHIS